MVLLHGRFTGSWFVPLTVTVEVPPRDREMLESWLRAPSLRAGLAQRARIVLLAADGVPVKTSFQKWWTRFGCFGWG
jgi:hypothetical protein